MRNATLESILTRYREEVGLSTNPRMNLQVRDAQVGLLRRMQEWLYDEDDWPHLKVTVRVTLEAGLSQYALPIALNPDRIFSASQLRDGIWYPLVATFGGAELTVRGDDPEDRSDALRAFEMLEDGTMSVWPTPKTNGNAVSNFIEIRGVRALTPLVAENDRAVVDDQLIYLYAAAETLTAAGDRSAAAKLEAANRRKERLLRQDSKIKKFKVGGGLIAPASGDGVTWG